MAEQRLLAVSPNLPCAMDRQEWSLEDYHVCKTLYNGYAAQVYTATCRYSGMEVVLKVYHDVDKAPDVAQHEMYREVAIQSGLQHPNIVHLFGAFEEGETLVLVQEYVPNGDLLALMQSHGGRVDEATVVKAVMRPLLGALMYLHRWGIVHRDVKPENVLFAADGSIKLADFGLAINMVEERPISRVGTLDYMAPEVLRCPIKQSMAMTPTPGSPARYGFATDVWAVGIVTFELLTGLPPYASDCRYQAESRICSSLPPIFPHSISPMARDFILRALAPVPGDRPTVRQLLDHPWIANPDACVAAGRPRAYPCPFSHTHPDTHTQPVPQPATSQSTVAASVLQPHPYGYSSDPQHTAVSRATAAAAMSLPPGAATVPASSASTAVSSPAASPARQDLHSQLSAAAAAAAAIVQGAQPLLHPPAHYHQHHHHHHNHRQHNCHSQDMYVQSIAQPVASGAEVPASASAVSIDQQLRALQQQQLLDLSKLPLDQIQGMIQKLQEAMQLAVVQQQRMQQEPLRTVVSVASVVEAASGAGAQAAGPGHSRCNADGVGIGAAITAEAPAAVSINTLRQPEGVEDVQMADVTRDAVEAVALATGAFEVASCMTTNKAAVAVAIAAHSCANSPQQQLQQQQLQQQQLQQQQLLPLQQLEVSIDTCGRNGPAAVDAAPSIIGRIVDSVSCISTATGYGSLCASRRTTLDATPRTAFAVVASNSPTQVSCARNDVPAPVVVHGGYVPMDAAVVALAPVLLPRRAEDGSPPQVTFLDAAHSGDAAAVLAAATPRATCSGGGGDARCSHGGAAHEGDGLVYVSIGSSRKAAGLVLCEGECPVGLSASGETDMSEWIRQFAAP